MATEDVITRQRVNYWRRYRKEAGRPIFRPVQERKTIEAEKVLEVVTDYFSAEAVWKKIYGIWSCVSVAPELRWMKGMGQQEAKLALLKMGASWKWISRCAIASGGELEANRGPLVNQQYEKLTTSTVRVGVGEGEASGNGASLAGSAVAGLSLQTVSLTDA